MPWLPAQFLNLRRNSDLSPSEKNLVRFMNQQSRQLLRQIKSTAAQLDQWNSDQRKLTSYRHAADARHPGGSLERRAIAHHQARLAIGTQGLTDPPCTLCNATTHLSDECDLLIIKDTRQIAEAPQHSILRAIVHRLFLSATNLRALHQDPNISNIPTLINSQNTSVSIDYLDIAIQQCLKDFLSIPSVTSSDIRNQRPECLLIIQLYHSKAFLTGLRTILRNCCRSS